MDRKGKVMFSDLIAKEVKWLDFLKKNRYKSNSYK